MLAYLAQEGLATDGRVSGLVDVGWMGRTFQALDTAMEQAALPLIHSFFYIGRSSWASRCSSPELAARQGSWLFDQTVPSGRPAQPSGIEGAVEALCTGTEGSLQGYRREGDRVVPVLAQQVNRAAMDWGLADLRRTVDLVVEKLTTSDAPLRRPSDLRGAADGVLRELWLRPDPREVALCGSTPDVTAQLRAGRLKTRPVFSWRAGTAAVSPPLGRQVLQAMIWYDRNRSRVRSLPRRVRLRLARRGAD